MPVKYPCLLWVAFSQIFPPQCRSFVPSNCVRPSGAGDFAHNTTKMRREGGRRRGVGGHQPAAASASGCGSTRITARTHMRLLPDPGRQEGRQSSARAAAPSGGESPRSSFNAKTSRTAASVCGDGCLTDFPPLSDIITDTSSCTWQINLIKNPSVSSESFCTQPLGCNLK